MTYKQKINKYLDKKGIKNEEFREFWIFGYEQIYREKEEHEKAMNRPYSETCQITKWCAKRGITIDDFVENGTDELTHVEKMLKHEKIRINTISAIKRFLRFLGHDVPFYDRERTIHFEEDEELNKHIELDIGIDKARTTKRAIRRAIKKFCKWRGDMTPTELVEEVKEGEITVDELRDKILEWKNELTEKLKSPMRPVNYLMRFYEFRANLTINLPPSAYTRKEKKRNNGRKITKKMIRKLLDCADLRDSMIIVSCFETGLNPCDLVSLTYGDFGYQDEYGNTKNYLNIEEPEKIDDVAVIEHKRQKTLVHFYAGFGVESLRLMSRWLKYRQKIKNDKITEETHIFTTKRHPFKTLTAPSLSHRFHVLSEIAGIETIYPRDCRNNFNTQLKKVLKQYDKEVLMGHIGGIEAHYDIDDIQHFKKEYRKAWVECFDLSINEERLSEEIKKAKETYDTQLRMLKRENEKLESKFFEVKMELEEVKQKQQQQKEREEILAEQEKVQVSNEQMQKYLSNLSKEELVELLLMKDQSSS